MTVPLSLLATMSRLPFAVGRDVHQAIAAAGKAEGGQEQNEQEGGRTHARTSGSRWKDHERFIMGETGRKCNLATLGVPTQQ